ncbi:MAG TPA: AMP-binding protein, partial [Patescibacteria group bacterium]|nr:AMP-binding protein [Patescibacteria group bacterium]
RNFSERQLYKAAKGAVRIAANIYGVRASGLDQFKNIKGPYVITPNHLSMFDAIVLAAMLPVEPAIAIDQDQYNNFMSHWWSRPLMRQANLFPLNPQNPYALKSLTRKLEEGKPILIYPEGRLTDDGNLSAIMEGASTVALNTDSPVVPVYLDGLQRLPIGTRTPMTYPSRWLPKIKVMVHPPRKLDVPEGLPPKARREAGRRALEKTMQELPVLALNKKKSLIDALHQAAGNYGMDRPMLDDIQAQEVTYKTILQKAYGLGGKVAEITEKGENVGVLLPTSVGAAVTLFGMNAFGRVFAPLNVGAKVPELVANSETAAMKTIITSRAMIEAILDAEKKAEKKIEPGMSEEKIAKIKADEEKKADDKIENKLAALSKNCRIVYLEDLRDSVGIVDKLKAGLRARGWFRPADRPSGEDHALTIFTSGSEGMPKGVAHSSYSLLANVEQVHAVTPIEPEQKVFNAMPIFHSFGLTGGILMPMLNGMQSFQFPSPLRGKEIPPLIYHYKAKIMFGTDTFLDLWSRSIKEKYKEKFFSRLEMIFAGAEAVKQKTRQTYFERFGKPIYEGYGRSEEGPVVAINVPGANTNGTLGRLLPCMEARFEDLPGYPDGKRLYLRGPNMAMGYIFHDNPGVIKPFEDGWDDTGDIISVNDEDYLKFVDRAKRLAKVGGEYVPLSNIDRAAQAASKNTKSEHFAVEENSRIALATTDPDLRGMDIARAAQELHISPLGLPKNQDIFFMKELPHLGTGKPDGMKIKQTIRELYNQRAAGAAPETAEPDADLAADNGELPPPPAPDNSSRPVGP